MHSYLCSFHNLSTSPSLFVLHRPSGARCLSQPVGASYTECFITTQCIPASVLLVRMVIAWWKSMRKKKTHLTLQAQSWVGFICIFDRSCYEADGSSVAVFVYHSSERHSDKNDKIAACCLLFSLSLSSKDKNMHLFVLHLSSEGRLSKYIHKLKGALWHFLVSK